MIPSPPSKVVELFIEVLSEMNHENKAADIIKEYEDIFAPNHSLSERCNSLFERMDEELTTSKEKADDFLKFILDDHYLDPTKAYENSFKWVGFILFISYLKNKHKNNFFETQVYNNILHIKKQEIKLGENNTIPSIASIESSMNLIRFLLNIY